MCSLTPSSSSFRLQFLFVIFSLPFLIMSTPTCPTNGTLQERGSTPAKLCGDFLPFPDASEVRSALLPGQPTPNRTFFYTHMTRELAYNAVYWAEQYRLAWLYRYVPPIWDPYDFINRTQYRGSREKRANFITNVCTTFAANTKGRVYLMMPRGAMPRRKSIFYSIEWPALRDSGAVDEIVLLDAFRMLMGRLGDPAEVNRYW